MNTAPVTFPMDVVKTPLGEYVVINYTDSRRDNSWDFSERFVGKFSTYDDEIDLDALVAAITEYSRENPDIIVEEYRRKRHFRVGTIDIPGGRIGDVLSDNSLLERARKEHETYAAKVRENKDPTHKYEAQGPLEKWIEGISINVKITSWNQLIRQSSANDLQCDKAPDSVIIGESGTGFIVIDGGMQANCGYGRSEVNLYEITGEEKTDQVGPFPRRTLQVRNYVNTWMQCLPPSAHEPSELKRIVASPEYRVFKFYGNLAVIGLPKGTRNLSEFINCKRLSD